MKLAFTCPLRFEDLDGEGRARACGACRKTVYDVTDCGLDELLALADREPGFCARWLTLPSGHLTTRPLLVSAMATALAACAAPDAQPLASDTAWDTEAEVDTADTADTADTVAAHVTEALEAMTLRRGGVDYSGRPDVAAPEPSPREDNPSHGLRGVIADALDRAGLAGARAHDVATRAMGKVWRHAPTPPTFAGGIQAPMMSLGDVSAMGEPTMAPPQGDPPSE